MTKQTHTIETLARFADSVRRLGFLHESCRDRPGYEGPHTSRHFGRFYVDPLKYATRREASEAFHRIEAALLNKLGEEARYHEAMDRAEAAREALDALPKVEPTPEPIEAPTPEGEPMLDALEAEYDDLAAAVVEPEAPIAIVDHGIADAFGLKPTPGLVEVVKPEPPAILDYLDVKANANRFPGTCRVPRCSCSIYAYRGRLVYDVQARKYGVVCNDHIIDHPTRAGRYAVADLPAEPEPVACAECGDDVVEGEPCEGCVERQEADATAIYTARHGLDEPRREPSYEPTLDFNMICLD